MSTDGPPPEIAAPPKATGSRSDRAAMGAARVEACLLTFAGFVGLFRVGTDFSESGTKDLAGFEMHPLTAWLWFLIGMTGIAMSVTAFRARRYLIGAGVVLTLWALIGLISRGELTSFFSDDPETVALMLVLGLGGLAIALAPTPVFLEEALALPDAEADDDAEGVRPPPAVVRRPPPSGAP